MEFWIGNKATLSQQGTFRKYSSLLQRNPIMSDEKVLKIVEAECDKSSGRELDGVIVLTSSNFYFISKKETIKIPFSTINDMSVKTDGKDKNEFQLTLRVGYSNRIFDDIKKNDDTDEFFEILEAKIINPNQDVLTTVTHNFETFLHADRLQELRRNDVKITSFLMKRDDMSLSKNGERLLEEKHPKALYVGEGFFRNKKNKKEGNFVVVDKTVWLYEYDNNKREAKKIIVWPMSFLAGALIDHYAIKTEILLPDNEKLVLNSGGKKFTEALDTENIPYVIKVRKWYQKILGFRSGKAWKKTIASLVYLFILFIGMSIAFGDDPESKPVKATDSAVQAVDEESKEDKKKQQEEEAKRIAAAEEKKKQEAEAKRIAEEKKKQEEEAARKAEEERIKKEEAAKAAAAEEERKRKEAEAAKAATASEAANESQSNVYYKNCTAVRAAGADPIRKGDPGYAKHLDRDGDGIACDR